MNRRALMTGFLLVLVMALIRPAAAVERPDAPPPALTEAGLEMDDLLLLEDEDGPLPPDLRVLVAAPRVAVIGKASSVLLVMRPGRLLHVEAGERVRFMAGVREAVWYRGSGAVRSSLSLQGGPAGDPALPLGEDHVEMAGSAPDVQHRGARVDVLFDSEGDHQVEAVVRTGVKPRKGKARGEARGAGYLVRVHPPATLGSVAGVVEDGPSGAPLAGYPVVALDAATERPVGAARTLPDGSYRIERLPPGDYIVAAPPGRGYPGEFFQDSPDAAGATTVTVATGAATGGVDFLLDRP